MSRLVYNLNHDVRGAAYARLLNYALNYCDSFILVIRDPFDMGDSAAAVLRRFEPDLIRSEEKNEWPGTQLLEGRALVNTYRLSPTTAAELAEAADGLFSWCQAELPEDLCLMREGGDPWLVTIAHESDGYLVLSPSEYTEILENIPELSLSLHEPQKGEDNLAH